MKISRELSAVAVGLALVGASATGLACSPEGYIGSMNVFGGNYAIRGCALAEGQLLDISQNSALFSILGTTYGGNGRTDFALPDTRGRSIVGVGEGPGLNPVSLGEAGGAENVSLSTDNLPAHSHVATTTVEVTASANAASTEADTSDPTGAVWAIAKKGKPLVYQTGAPDVTMRADAVSAVATATTSLDSSGGGQEFSIRDPYLGMHWLIQISGVFPPRN